MLNSEKFAVLLKELGRPVDTSGALSCPLHSQPLGTLYFHPNDILPGGFHAVCTHPKCGFSGSVLDLASAVKKRTIQEVSQMFTPGNPLHGLFFESSGNDASDVDYVRFEVIRSEEHCRAAEYLLRGKSAFMNNSMARQFLVGRGIKEDLLQKLMCCNPVPNAPDRLAGCMPVRMQDNYVVLPYLSAGVTTDVVIYDIRDGSRSQHSLENKSRGIFLSEFLPRTGVKNITVCHSDLDAMVLLTKISDVGAAGINPVAVIDPESVLQLPSLESITLLSHSDTPAPLSHVLDYLRLSPTLKISVAGLVGPLNVVSSTKVRKIFEGSMDGWTWMASRINAIARDEGLERLTAQLTSLGLARPEKSMILEKLQELGITNSMLMQEVRNARPACLTRDCGSIRIKRTFAGYEQILPCSRILSNFILIVNYYTGEPDSKVLAATIKTARPNCPGYDITIPVKTLMTKDGNKIMHLIWNRLIELGVKFDAYALSTMDIDWFTVVRIFDGADYKAQSRLIGIEGHCINYPGMKVNLAAGTITMADVLPNLPDIVMQSYGLVAGAERDISLPARLHAHKDDAVDSFLGIMGHVLHETSRAAKPGYRPRHLLIPYTLSESITDVMLGQLNFVLGGGNQVLEIPGDPKLQKQFFARQRLLGRLPVIFRASTIVDQLPRYLNQAHHSMVVMYPATQLPRKDRIANAYYLSEIMIQDHYELSHEVLEMLRARWASMLIATYSAELASDMPALSWMDKFCGGLPDSYLFTAEPFNNGDTNDYDQFLEALAHMAEMKTLTIAPDDVSFSSAKRAATDVGFYKGNYVKIQPGALWKVMRQQGLELPWNKISSLMTANGAWVENSHYRQIPIPAWDLLVCKSYKLRMLTSEDLVKTA